MSAVLPLQQLQRFALSQGFEERLPLLQVAQLPSLQQLSLLCWNASEAAPSATAWAHVLQLCALTIMLEEEAPPQSTMTAILDGIAACTQLTELHLKASAAAPNGDDSKRQAVAVCGKLGGLTNLQELCISGRSKLVAGDARALTTLTGLTELNLSGLGAAVNDAAAGALARSLKQLQHLNLGRCELGDMLGQLTQLTTLGLCSSSGLTQEGLMLLTGLTRLQQLWVGGCAQVTDNHVEEFWAAVRPKR
uniref:Uncharacterized protein n=1 Tax=Tetradesmus obliquus TaxID=3088 RepID=A0A383VLW3_TETOB|eukprot:jgi/Sobl393_1/15389/SZX65809.1